MIYENMTFQYIYRENRERIRVIYIDYEQKFLYYVNIDASTSMPRKELVDKLESEINNSILMKIV